MNKYIAYLSWTSFFVLWWLLILGVVEPGTALANILLFGMLGALAGLPSTPRTSKPPSGGNGRHARREQRPRREGK